LKSMVDTKIKDLNKPRSEVLPMGKQVPRRIQNLVYTNERHAIALAKKPRVKSSSDESPDVKKVERPKQYDPRARKNLFRESS
jgi:hypothetical protein